MELTVGRGRSLLGSATGGDGNFTYSITPALPAGMSLNTATGEITGAPEAPSGLTTYTYTATDGEGSSNSAMFTIKVNAAPTLQSPDTLYFGTGKAIPAVVFEAAKGGTGTITYEVTGAPHRPQLRLRHADPFGHAEHGRYDDRDLHRDRRERRVGVGDVRHRGGRQSGLRDAGLGHRVVAGAGLGHVPTLTQTFDVGGGQVTVTFADPGRQSWTHSTSGQESPATSKTITGGMDENSVRLFGHFPPNNGNTLTATVAFAHTGGVYNVRFKVLDIDKTGGGFTDDTTDEVTVTGTAAGSTINPTSVVTSLRNSFDGTNTVTGTGAANAGSDALSDTTGVGTAAFRFATEDITEVTDRVRRGLHRLD